MVQMVPVESSSIECVGYDATSQELHVKFRSGPAVFVYVDVPPEEYAALMEAGSKGHYVATQIKTRFNFKRIDPSEEQVATPTQEEIDRATSRAMDEEGE